MIYNFNIKQFLSLEGYETSRKERRKGLKGTNEFFTPYEIVKRMCDKVDEKTWADPSKTFLEPCQGHGQFVLFILYRRIHEYGIGWEQALNTLYALELMEDNVMESRARVHMLLKAIAPEYDPKKADEIMDNNFVCHDFFKWDFEHWRPYTDEELKILNKKK